MIFDGASMCFDDSMEILVKIGKAFDEDFILFDTKEKYQPIKKCERSL
ncbi:MAG: hypothetical protein MZV64_45705 [Ignavibacteriales bacterium]|nr:hypothetical protein [Ignavibacteriales bacterium]